MQGVINVEAAMEDASSEAGRMRYFTQRQQHYLEELALEEWKKADDRDAVKAYWGDYLTASLERWNQSQRFKAAYWGKLQAYEAGKITRQEVQYFIHAWEEENLS